MDAPYNLVDPKENDQLSAEEKALYHIYPTFPLRFCILEIDQFARSKPPATPVNYWTVINTDLFCKCTLS